MAPPHALGCARAGPRYRGSVNHSSRYPSLRTGTSMPTDLVFWHPDRISIFNFRWFSVKRRTPVGNR